MRQIAIPTRVERSCMLGQRQSGPPPTRQSGGSVGPLCRRAVSPTREAAVPVSQSRGVPA
jgi:hypothetical protein